jgi:hypothetical protein
MRRRVAVVLKPDIYGDIYGDEAAITVLQGMSGSNRPTEHHGGAAVQYPQPQNIMERVDESRDIYIAEPT